MTDCAWLIETVQVVAVPVQAPDQLVKVEPAAGAAVRVTDVPLLKLAEHVLPQLIPAGLLVTVPVSVPARVVVSAYWMTANVAVTDCAWLIATVQVVAVPVQAPDQPVKLEPAVGAAVRVTDVPLLKLAEHVLPQLIPAGLLVTVPVPAPDLLTVSA